MRKRRALVVVAHPDDETMFAGGTIAKFPWDWTVVSAAHSLEKDRGKEFARACSILGAKPIMLDLPYGGKENLSGIDEQRLRESLHRVLAGRQFDLVLTHNLEGEYGSLDHQCVSRVVRSMPFPHVWEFGFNQAEYDLAIRLGEAERSAKSRAFQAYASQSQRIVLMEIGREERFLWKP